jgi:hypothetical protein
MNVRAAPGTAVDRYLRLVRLPLDAAIGRLPGNAGGVRPVARLFVDRADASARGLFAAILSDSSLREDAEQRRAAVQNRERAVRLRGEAERKTEQADTRLEDGHAQAEGQRARARQRAEGLRKQAAQQRDTKAARAAEAEKKRLDASHGAKGRVDAAIDERAPKDRLKTLDAKARALAEKEQVLTASDEARRLSETASRTKTERKNGST